MLKHHPDDLPDILREETRRDESSREQETWKLANTSDAVQQGSQADHSAETGPTASPREKSPKPKEESPAGQEEAQDGDSPDCTNATGLSRSSREESPNPKEESSAGQEEAEDGDSPDCENATGLSGSPRSYRRSTTRWSEARLSTSPSSYRPSTARSSTRRSLSPSENGPRAVEERAQAELPVILSDDDDSEVTFLSAQTKPPGQVAETRASPSRGGTRPHTTGSARPDKRRIFQELRINWHPTVSKCHNEKSYKDLFGCLQSSSPEKSPPVSVALCLSHQLPCAPRLSGSGESQCLGARIARSVKSTVAVRSSFRSVHREWRLCWPQSYPSSCVQLLFDDKLSPVISISSKPVFGGNKNSWVCRSDLSVAYPSRSGKSNY